MRAQRGVLLIATLLVACSGKGKKKAEEKPPIAEPSTASDAASADAWAIAHSPVPEYTPEQRQAYREHLEAGRKLAHAAKWGEACREFEAALAAVPMDARALSELGWATFQAGDYDRARQANADSVRVAVEPALKAAGLYNLGRVAEATGEREQAAQLYRESIRLRPNEDVEERLEALGETAPAPTSVMAQSLPCTAPAPRDRMCPCLVAALARSPLADAASEGLTCRTEPSGLAKLEVARVSSEREEVFYLIDGSDVGWSVAARLGKTFNPGKFGIDEQFRIAKAEPRTLGQRRVLWIEGHHVRSNVDALVGEEERRELHVVTLCVVPEDASAQVRCPLQFPISDHYLRRRFEDDLAEDMPEIATPDLPVETSVRLRVDLADDGTVTLVLVEGEKTGAIAKYLGPHHLW